METSRIPQETRADVVRRLNRAAGQLKAVARALEEGGDCEAILHQMTAAKAAVERAGVKMLSSGLAECLRERHDDDLTPTQFEKLFMEFA